jgi:hypothetical protein
LELARNGVPKAPFYVTGRIGDRAFSVHAEGERMILKREGQSRQEVELTAPDAASVPLVSPANERAPSEVPLPVCPDGSPRDHSGILLSSEEDEPGTSPLDEGLRRLDQAIPGLQPESQADKEGCHDEQP